MRSVLPSTLFEADAPDLDARDGVWNGKSLLQRATGRFYTPEAVGRPLASRMAEHLAAQAGVRPSISAIDPFCGDGRLIEWLLEESCAFLKVPWSITLWDTDVEAVRIASARVDATARRLGVDIEIRASVGDTFDLAPTECGSHVAVITNPPWELLKPDRRELRHLDKTERDAYVASVRALDERLSSTYPTAQPRRRFAGWGTNLARVGTEVAVRLTADGGSCGIVTPSSLFADTNSERLRQWLFETTTLLDISYFPAEARLFADVDQPCVTFVAAKAAWASTLRFRMTRFDDSCGIRERGYLELSRSDLASADYIVPVSFGAVGMQLLHGMSHLPTLGELEPELGFWTGRELDETNRRRYILPAGQHPFLKARNVHRFSRDHATNEYVDGSVVRIPPSTRHPRVVWRDVSRPTQKRRVQATLIEPGWVTGNSLHVAYSKADDLPRLAWLLGVMSSLPFEYQLRSMLSTGHVSMSSVRRVRLPTPDSAKVAELVRRRFAKPSMEPELEGAVADAYGLDRAAIAAMIEAFPKISQDEGEALIGACS